MWRYSIPRRLAQVAQMQTSALHCRLLKDSSGGAGSSRARAYHHARQALAQCHEVCEQSTQLQLALSADEVRKQQRLYDVYAHPTSPWLQFQ